MSDPVEPASTERREASQAREATEPPEAPLAIICGGGSLAFAVAEAVARRGRRFVLLPIQGWADPAAVARYPHRWITLGRFGQIRRAAEQEGCRDVVMIGTVLRPRLWQIRLDWETVRLLP